MMVDRHWKVPVYFGVPDNMHWVWIRTLTVSSGNPTKMPADPATKNSSFTKEPFIYLFIGTIFIYNLEFHVELSDGGI